MVNGKAAVTAAACSALSPPANNRADATKPSAKAQNKRVPTGGLGLPPDAMISITIEAESDDVTKNNTMHTVASPTASMTSNGD